MKFIKTDQSAQIEELRKKLYQRFLAPIDAMWEQLYVASAQHYFIQEGSQNMGYCCIDEEGSLLQIFLHDEFNHLMGHVIRSLIESRLISNAKLSSMEPISFNACLFHSKSIQPNTFCFQHSDREWGNDSPLNIVPVAKEDIPAVKAFLNNQIGFDDTFGYTENLVERGEIFMVKEAEEIIATSELRMSDTQPDFADLGVIVNNNYRGKGIATKILSQQAKSARNANRQPICSTTHDNIASKKAIEKAGFYCASIIFDIRF